MLNCFAQKKILITIEVMTEGVDISIDERLPRLIQDRLFSKHITVDEHIEIKNIKVLDTGPLSIIDYPTKLRTLAEYIGVESPKGQRDLLKLADFLEQL